ncbi:hypothetical protein L198_01368 [Cryptococcus wingfieldii CBS 7118]|uniref:Uncharacterized protein n=1 Tax=Cryptococcus wingfieldii CBS 7118 TaxID=1295528 RepID=A0A1E3JZC7_9TREE|nr:hypothetical protein L198_01368 [Cryptococcus wingfieldii CBS 7118]ODO06136.1 hypothetical protein L198_01368 [Cryptococcus wingfieldii CBS 7118]
MTALYSGTLAENYQTPFLTRSSARPSAPPSPSAPQIQRRAREERSKSLRTISSSMNVESWPNMRYPLWPVMIWKELDLSRNVNGKIVKREIRDIAREEWARRNGIKQVDEQ